MTEYSQSCPHCHKMNRIYPGTNIKVWCEDCEHRIDVGRKDCDCVRCTTRECTRATPFNAQIREIKHWVHKDTVDIGQGCEQCRVCGIIVIK